MIYLFIFLYVLFEFVFQKHKQLRVEEKLFSKSTVSYLIVELLGSFSFVLWFSPQTLDLWLVVLLIVAIKMIVMILRFYIDTKLVKFRAYQLCDSDKKKSEFKQKYVKFRFALYHFIQLFFVLFLWSQLDYYITDVYSFFGLSNEASFILIGLFFILLTIVANQIFKLYFSTYNPNIDKEENDVKSGSLIGSLERIVMMVLLVVGQWVGLTIVIAAKSIARFKQLEDKKFSEYYLIGTLYSIIYVIVIYYLLLGDLFN